MSKSKLFTIFCACLLLVFVYGCNKASNEGEAAEAGNHSHEGEQAGHTHEAGEQSEHSTSEEAEHEYEEEAGHEHGEAGEHEHGAEGEGGEGEEAGPRIPLAGTHDEVRKGIRLIMTYDAESSAFTGTVENVSDKTVSNVRVEVHLSDGTELGPTKPIELAPGKKAKVMLSAEGQEFDWWKAHAESGASEH